MSATTEVFAWALAMSEAPTITNDQRPLVTIAIPTFNRVGFLRSSLSSALSQTYPQFEVLVSDNASTDGTEVFLKTVSDPRLRVIRQKSNIGLLPNWNACLSNATGEYIVLLPDDDSLEPHFLDRCVELLKLRPRLPAVIALANGRRIDVGNQNLLYPAIKSITLDTGVWDGLDIFSEFLKDRITVQSCTAFMRTEYLRMRGGFRVDLPYAADLAAWGPLLMMDKCGLINEGCGSFTIHLESQTKVNSLEIKVRDHKEVIESLVAIVRSKAGADPVKRARIFNEALININNNITGLMLRDLQAGGVRTKIIAVLWRYRRDIFVNGLTLKNGRRLIRVIILVLLPPQLHNFLRDVKSRVCDPLPHSPNSISR